MQLYLSVRFSNPQLLAQQAPILHFDVNLALIQVVDKAMGNDLYDKSDHKWLMADVVLE